MWILTFRHITVALFSILNICMVATSMIEQTNKYQSPSYYLRQLLNRPSKLERQGALTLPAAQGFVDVLMFGLAGIPVYKAVETLLPFLKISRKPQNSRDNGRVINRRSKRDLAYAKQLLALLLSVENTLEKYGITEPQCQLRATCEIHGNNGNKARKMSFERNIIKLVRKMREEIKNPKVVPLAKYVFEYYEEAAERGEQRLNCAELYHRCPQSLDDFYNQAKGTKTSKFPAYPGYKQQQSNMF